MHRFDRDRPGTFSGSASLALLASSVALLASSAGAHGKHPRKPGHAPGGAVAGAIYSGDPFTDDPFSLQVSKDGRSATVTGTFTYTNPGCPNQGFGNIFLTSANAPRMKVAASGSFKGVKRVHADGEGGPETIMTSISGKLEGTSGTAELRESRTCPGDKPLVIKVKLKEKK
ncbi:MAG: hypothetical protein ACYCU0_00460 [Solirubrobacteraceae bacterium]